MNYDAQNFHKNYHAWSTVQTSVMMMIIAPNSCAHKGKKEKGEVKGEYGGVCGEEGNADYGGMV